MATSIIEKPFGKFTEINASNSTETDFNNVTKAGIYYYTAITTNRPSGTSYWYVIVIEHGYNVLRQIAFEGNGQNAYTRYRNSAGTWNEWILFNQPFGLNKSLSTVSGETAVQLAQRLVENELVPENMPFVGRVSAGYWQFVEGYLYTSSNDKKYGYMHIGSPVGAWDVRINADTYIDITGRLNYTQIFNERRAISAANTWEASTGTFTLANRSLVNINVIYQATAPRGVAIAPSTNAEMTGVVFRYEQPNFNASIHQVAVLDAGTYKVWTMGLSATSTGNTVTVQVLGTIY